MTPEVDRPAGRVRVQERFSGPRVRARVGRGRRARSLVGLLVTALVLGLLLAAGVSAGIWAIANAIHHATTS